MFGQREITFEICRFIFQVFRGSQSPPSPFLVLVHFQGVNHHFSGIMTHEIANFTIWQEIINFGISVSCFPDRSWKPISSKPFLGGSYLLKKGGVHVVSPNIASPGLAVELLYAWDDEYEGIIVDPYSLPLSSNAFASTLRASLLNWKLKVRYTLHILTSMSCFHLIPHLHCSKNPALI